MSPAALSVRLYGSYAVLLGALLVVFPDTLARWLMVEPNAISFRWVGLFAIVIGVLFRQGSDHDDAWMLRSSIWMRIGVGIGLAIMGIFSSSWNLLFLTAIDLGSALWTRAASARHWQ